MFNILVVGKKPPPVGGVTIFISRFEKALKKVENTTVLNLSFSSYFNRIDAVHINSSNPVKRLFWILFFSVRSKNIYYTIHGGDPRLNNFFNRISLKIVKGVFCLNKNVHEALLENKIHSMMHTTIFQENLPEFERYLVNRVNRKKDSINVLFYINNDSLRHGKEIYGASFILEFLNHIKNDSLSRILFTVVDLSGCYKEKFKSINNVKLKYIDNSVNFIEFLSLSDIYIRPTSTDGNSVALLEASILGLETIASDVVSRPKATKLYSYGDVNELVLVFRECVNNIISNNNSAKELNLNSVIDLVAFMENRLDF
ncbi:hypothetical protein [Vibrio natriegens]|uniref:hypothetical protein n=1 Tax=Vibrio natriegens TaxID=691 RepID=UPI003B5B9EF4